ncbi:hypothetical protein GAP86_19095 [Salmonella enterica]|nr:hypothetical protein [Salmonella enterica]
MNHVIEPVCTVLPTTESKTVYLFFTRGEKARYSEEFEKWCIANDIHIQPVLIELRLCVQFAYDGGPESMPMYTDKTEQYIRTHGMDAYLEQIKRFVKRFVAQQPVAKPFGEFGKPFQE